MSRRVKLQLIREVMDTSPDGNSVKSTQAMDILAHWPAQDPRKADGYFSPGDWRIVAIKEWDQPFTGDGGLDR